MRLLLLFTLVCAFACSRGSLVEVLETEDGIPLDLAAGDWNGDGLEDLLTLQAGSNHMSLYSAKRGGGFMGKVELPYEGFAPGALALADLDGDGHLDGVAVPQLTGDLLVLRGNGQAQITLERFPYKHSARSVALADVNGDGHLDIAAGSRVLFSDGPGTFVTSRISSSGVVLSHVVAGDLDGDGTAALVFSEPDTGEVGAVLMDASSPLSLRRQPLLQGAFTARDAVQTQALADLNGDGHPDLVLAASDRRIALALGDGVGGFAAPRFLQVSSEERGTVTGVVAKDLDRDGALDLIVAVAGTVDLFSRASGALSVLMNKGQGTFGEPEEHPLDRQLNPTLLRGGDTDGNGVSEAIFMDGLRIGIVRFD